MDASQDALTAKNLVDIILENENNWRSVVVMARNIINCKEKDKWAEQARKDQ